MPPKKKIQKPKKRQIERGFDLGKKQKIMWVNNVDFNQYLREAGIVGCAYGATAIDGFPNSIPALTLLCQNEAAIKKAFQCFAEWGCEEDGDVVDIQLILHKDGTYKLWIAPEFNRWLNRRMPSHRLYEPITFNMAYVKPVDTTNPLVHRMKEYAKDKLYPIDFGAALVNGPPQNQTPQDIWRIPNLPRVIKFNIPFIEEAVEPDNPFFHIEERESIPSPSDSGYQDKNSPPEICESRKQVLDIAFPLTRERMRRSGVFQKVKAVNGFEEIAEDQVIQAAINLFLSTQLCNGALHFSTLWGKKWEKEAWDYIDACIDSNAPALPTVCLDVQNICKQIELDVRAILAETDVDIKDKTFAECQSLFRSMGYVHD